MAKSMEERFALTPPAKRVFRGQGSHSYVRFSDARYFYPKKALVYAEDNQFSEELFWESFSDGSRKFEQQERYAGIRLNCGHFFSYNDAAAVAECDFYNPGTDWRSSKARVAFWLPSHGLLNLTEPDCIDFIFDEVLEIPYKRGSLRLAALASIESGGNFFTDYVGAWAYHKGYEGVMFLSARALRPFRADFDVSSRDDEIANYYWSGLASDLDVYAMDDLRERIRTSWTNYANVVYFRGNIVLSRLETFLVELPSGQRFEGFQPHLGKTIDLLRKDLHFVAQDSHKENALLQLRKLDSMLSEVRRNISEVIEMHESRSISNAAFGSWMEDKFLRSGPFTPPTKSAPIARP